MSPGPVGHPGVVGVPEGNGSQQGFEVGSPDVPGGEVQQADQEPAHDRFVEAPDAAGAIALVEDYLESQLTKAKATE